MAITKATAGPQKKVRIGLLGCGFMGKCHSNAYKKIPYIYPEAKFTPCLAVLCDQKAEIVEREAVRYGYEAYCSDWKELVADSRIDVFDNCGPDPVHPEPCIAALKAGKHVICEKPMAIRVEDARRMRDAAATATGKSICTFNYRFMPAVRFAKDLIAAGRIGTIYHVRIHYLQMAGHDPTLPPDKVWCSSWPFSGALQGIGSHAIDQCRFLVGEIKGVSALVRTFNKDRAIPSVGCSPDVLSDEGAAALLDFENGATGVLESSVVATGRKNYLGWEINGSHGSLRWDLEHPNSLFACMDGAGDDVKGDSPIFVDAKIGTAPDTKIGTVPVSLLGFTEISVTENCHPYVGAWWPPGHNIGWEHGQIIEKFHFLDAVANDKPVNPCNATFEDGYRTAVIIDAMRKSSRTGQQIHIQF